MLLRPAAALMSDDVLLGSKVFTSQAAWLCAGFEDRVQVIPTDRCLSNDAEIVTGAAKTARLHRIEFTSTTMLRRSKARASATGAWCPARACSSSRISGLAASC